MGVPLTNMPAAFPAVFVSTNTTSVSHVLTPEPEGEDASSYDAFASGDEEENVPARQLSLANIIDPPRIELAALNRDFQSARKARGSGELADALRSYSSTLRTLERPFSPIGGTTPLYRHIPEGRDLLRESLFEAAILSGPGQAPRMLARLSRFIEDSEDEDGISVEVAKAMLIKSYKMMQHTMVAPQPKSALIASALDISENVRRSLDPKIGEESSDAHFYSGLLSVELLARLIAMAHNRRAFRERNILIEKQRQVIKEILSLHLTEERKEAISTYVSDSAILMARLGLWSPALERARTITAPMLASTSGARRLFNDPLFDPFVDGARVLSASEIKFRSKRGSWVRRFQAALALARASKFKKSAFINFVGLLTGFGASAFYGFEHSVLASLLGVALFSTANRFMNGWNSLEARYAAESGFFDRTPTETAMDGARLMAWGGLNSATWLFPAALVNTRGEGISTFIDTLSNTGDMYMNLGDAALGLFDPDTYNGFIPDSLSLRSAAELIIDTYKLGAAAVFGASLMHPRIRAHASKLAFLFIPGAALLSADIGTVLAGQELGDIVTRITDPNYIDRLGIASIAGASTFVMMLTAGLMPLSNIKSFDQAVKSLWRAANPKTGSANYSLPLSAIMIAGLMSPLGGHLQTGHAADGFALRAIQGVAIALGLMPISVLMGGVLKGFVPIASGVKEGWQDAKGRSLNAALLESIRGGLSAFSGPYIRNRLFKSFTFDLPGAAMRSFVGWDTSMGQFMWSASSNLSGNAMATATWPEASATPWERYKLKEVTGELSPALKFIDSLLEAGKISAEEAQVMRADAMKRLLNFFTDAGQVANVFHPFMEHQSLADRLWPIYAFARPVQPPKYPQMPNADFYASLHQMLTGGHSEKFSAEDVEALFEYVKFYARDPSNFELLQPLVKTLALSRNDPVFGERIDEFFRDEPWVADVLSVDLDKFEPTDRSKRRAVRRDVKRRIKKPFDEYEQRVVSHRRQAKLADQLSALFMADEELLRPAES